MKLVVDKCVMGDENGVGLEPNAFCQNNEEGVIKPLDENNLEVVTSLSCAGYKMVGTTLEFSQRLHNTPTPPGVEPDHTLEDIIMFKSEKSFDYTCRYNSIFDVTEGYTATSNSITSLAQGATSKTGELGTFDLSFIDEAGNPKTDAFNLNDKVNFQISATSLGADLAYTATECQVYLKSNPDLKVEMFKDS